MMKKFVRWPVLLIFAALFVAILVPVFPLLHAGKLGNAHASNSAAISLSSLTGQPGSAVQVSGQGFAANDQINIDFMADTTLLLASVAADATGNLPTTSITVPAQPTGQYTVTATQESSNISASTTFSIVPIFTISPEKVRPGESVTITGAGFSGQDYIELYLDTLTGNNFASFGSNASGSFSWQIAMPLSSVLQGPHTVIAKSLSSGDMATFPVTFLPRAFPVVGKAGMSVTLLGAGFTASETVQVYWGAQTGQLEGTATTDGQGNFSFAFTTPTNLAPGSYPITVVRSHQKPSLISTEFKLIPVTLTSTPGIRSGQQVKVSGTGFLPDEGITIGWNANGGQQLATSWTDKNGSFQTTFLPPSAPPGAYTLTATGGTSGLQATSNLDIGPGVSGGVAIPGQTISVSGGGFQAGESVNVYFQTTKNGVISTTTDTTGAFTVQLTLPSTYNPSTTYYIHAVSSDGSEHARAAFKFATLSFAVNGFPYYNQPITFVGSNFAVGEIVNIIWNYQQAGQYTIATVKAYYSGSFNFFLPAPSTPDQSTVTVAAIGATSKLTATTSIQVYPTVDLSPITAVAGTKVTVSGGNFGATETIDLLFNGTAIATTTSKSDGTFTASFKVPPVSGAGNIIVQATGATSGISATTPFFYKPVLTLTPSVVQNGDTITVTGKHFSASTGISLYLPMNRGGTGAITNASGAFTTTIQVSGLQSGTYYVSAQDGISNLFTVTAFVVR